MLRALCFLAVLAPRVAAEVSAVVVETREPVLEGRPFGDVGAYERLTGRIEFRFDPAHPRNAAVVDLALAPRNAEGWVEAWADFVVLRPVDPERGSGTALLEVSNRGGKASLAYFNRARSSSLPTTEDQFGDGLLMRRGFTVIWVGWQFDVPLGDDLLRLHVPRALGADPDGKEPVTGLVRSDWTVDTPTSLLPVAHRDHVPYPVRDPEDPRNVLTVRDGRDEPRRVVPRKAWSFEGDSRIRLPSGFQVGKLYELVYVAEDPAVVGLGLAAIRDTISYAKHSADSPFHVERGIAVGISQTGRFLRHFLYQGFNTDEAGRQAFEGLLIHTAGAGRGSFNHRFAQPSRDAHRYSAFFYPTDLFPFSGRAQRDPLLERREGLLDRARADGHVPRIFYTNTGYEYWGRAASLLHTSGDGSADVEPLPEERIYHLAGGQHFVSGFPPEPDLRLSNSQSWRGNPLDFLNAERALLVALQAWVEHDEPPPPSAYPRVDQGTLVPLAEFALPAIPGLAAPTTIHEAYRADYGPRWSAGIIDLQPPQLGPTFVSQVCRVDALGNECAGVRSLELLAPLATYTPWCLRTGFAGGAHELYDFFGTFTPLARTDEERDPADARPSLAELYPSKDAYLESAETAATELVRARFLLDEDVPRVLARAERTWDWILSR